MNWKIVALATMGLTACQLHPPFPIASHDACGASNYEHLLGQSRTAVEAETFTQPVRIIPRNASVTLDFQPERINFVLNYVRRVVAITCG